MMIQILSVGGAVLAVLVVLNLLLTLSLVGRLRTLQEALANQLNGRDPALPNPGDRVGPFQATTAEGEPLTDAALREGKTLVGFFAAGCRPCASLRQQILDTPPAVPLLAFVEGVANDPETLALGASLKPVGRVAYLADGDSITRAIKQAGYPTLVLIDGGVVAAAGHHLHEVLP